MMKKPELLLPAGAPEALKTAILYGADAVYAGVPSLSLRAKTAFDEGTLADAIKETHDLGKKIYLTLNLFSKNDDAERLDEFAALIGRLAPDGLIVSDPGVFVFMREKVPHSFARFDASQRRIVADRQVLAGFGRESLRAEP